MDLTEVIKRPVITEKSTLLFEQGQYTFQVARQATKKEIKQAVERCFDKVRVESVKTAKMKGKVKRDRRSGKYSQEKNWKKAVVQLAEGDKIDILPTAPTEKKKKKVKNE